jgi:mRNA interferase MazF
MTTVRPFSHQGEFWETNFEPTMGHEQSGAHPALILSVDGLNAARWVSVVLPTSSQFKDIPTRIHVGASKTGLEADFDVLWDQIRSVDHGRVLYRRSTVSRTTLQRYAALVERMIKV